MKTKNLTLMFGLAAGMALTVAPKANAGVAVGVRVGAPVYVQPARAYTYGTPRRMAVRMVPVYRKYYVAPRLVYRKHGRARHERFQRRSYGRR